MALQRPVQLVWPREQDITQGQYRPTGVVRACAGLDANRFITDTRWMAVLDAAAALGGWSAPLGSGSARGIAIGSAFNSIVACVVEISGISSSAVTVRRVSVAIDCYLTVNPANVEAQIMGGVIHGLNAALYGQRTFANGAAQKSNFNTQPVLKLKATPAIAVTVIPAPVPNSRRVAIGGVGELGVPCVAPALANAMYRLNKVRQRDLPLFPAATMGGL